MNRCQRLTASPTPATLPPARPPVAQRMQATLPTLAALPIAATTLSALPLAAALLFGLLSASSALGQNTTPQTQAATAAATSVQTARLDSVWLQPERSAAATVLARNESRLSAEVGGRVLSQYPDGLSGQQVESLVGIRASMTRAALYQLEANRKAVKERKALLSSYLMLAKTAIDKVYAEHLSKGGSDIAGYLGASTLRINEPGRTFWLKAQIALD